MNNYDYPAGADNSSAPWNEPADLPEKEIEVTVSITMSKTFTIKVNDYVIEKYADEDGCSNYYDYSKCNLEKAVREQIYLPDEAYRFYDKNQIIKQDLSGWNTDDFVVNID
jgi:hypothetical protein